MFGVVSTNGGHWPQPSSNYGAEEKGRPVGTNGDMWEYGEECDPAGEADCRPAGVVGKVCRIGKLCLHKGALVLR